jgi:hypothetical protein
MVEGEVVQSKKEFMGMPVSTIQKDAHAIHCTSIAMSKLHRCVATVITSSVTMLSSFVVLVARLMSQLRHPAKITDSINKNFSLTLTITGLRGRLLEYVAQRFYPLHDDSQLSSSLGANFSAGRCEELGKPRDKGRH